MISPVCNTVHSTVHAEEHGALHAAGLLLSNRTDNVNVLIPAAGIQEAHIPSYRIHLTPRCTTDMRRKASSLLRLISDEVPHRFIALMLKSHPPGTKFVNVNVFFIRVAIHTKRHETLRNESKSFKAFFEGSKSEKVQRGAQLDSSANSSARTEKSNPTITVEATTVHTVVPFSK